MKKYRYSKLGYVAIGIVFALFFLFFKGILADAFSPGAPRSYQLFTIALTLMFMFYVALILHDVREEIIVTDLGIALKTPFKSITLKWDEVIEFGKYRKMFWTRGWAYYVKSLHDRDKRITLFTEHIMESAQLIETIRTRCAKASFVSHHNVAAMPFVRTMETIPWEPGD